MKSKPSIVVTGITILIAFIILSVSFLRIATPNVAYSPIFLSGKVESKKDYIPVNYLLAYPGKIGPDSYLWYAKVMRDRLWYLLTFDELKKRELNLLFADKRLNSALLLFQNNKPDLGLSTLTKAEKYLEKSIQSNTEDVDYVKKVALSSLKHREIIEMEILPLSPEDIAPKVNSVNDYSKEAYKKARDILYSKGLTPPRNVFELQ